MPGAGKSHVRFDERGVEMEHGPDNEARQTKEPEPDRPDLNPAPHHGSSSHETLDGVLPTFSGAEEAYSNCKVKSSVVAARLVIPVWVAGAER